MISLNATITNPQHDQFTSAIILPEDIYAYKHLTVFMIFPMLNQYWMPLERDVYLLFSNRNGNGDYRDAKLHFKDATNITGTVNLVHTMVFDRSMFSIDEGSGTVLSYLFLIVKRRYIYIYIAYIIIITNETLC